jgi:6-phosphofructokinase 1
MNVGILTAGGTCPGVNEFTHYISKFEKSVGNRVFGFKDGFHGLNRNQRVNLSIHHMNQSYDKVDVDLAVRTMKHIDRLYCICGNESMNDACVLALDDRIDTNIIGIAKSIYNDVPGLECLGFRSAIGELTKLIDTLYFEATTSHSIYFLVVPGLHSDDLIKHTGYARKNKISMIITPHNDNSITLNILKSNYKINGHGVVIVSEKCNFVDIIDKMSDIPTTVINPGNRIKDVEACLYDGILATSMARESFLYAQGNTNFIKGASSIIKFEDYLNIV